MPFDVERIRKDGSIIEISSGLSPIKNNNGKIIGIMGIARDITERRQVEKEIARLDRLNIIGEMAASISHEIRNPMTTVRGFLQLLGTKPNIQEYKDYFNLMIEELDRANLIISEFLSLSKNNPVEYKMTNFNNILTKLLPMLQADAPKRENGLEIKLGEIPDCKLDEKEIRQVILNIARNGLEAMSANGILTIETYLEHDKVVISFRDQGSGILPEILENIGKPFLTTKDNGTGLGLPVTYSIVHRYDGTVSIDTGTDGTIFYIKFPINNRVDD